MDETGIANNMCVFSMTIGVVKENVDIRRSEIQFVGKSSTEVVPTRFIIPLVGAVSRPTLAVILIIFS